MSADMTEVDVVVVGGGMAGVSVAAAIAPRREVLLVEQEDQLATGRSAASYVTSYGPAPVRSLTRASGAALRAMDQEGAPVLTARPLLWVAFDDQALAELDRLGADDPHLERIDGAGVRLRHDALRSAPLGGAADAGACDLDAMAVHQAYVRRARAAGAGIRRGARVLGADRSADGRLLVETTTGRVSAGSVVNAAGAWADALAELFGAAPVGLRPLRRTLAVARASRPIDATWPFVVDVGGRFYFKPEGPHVLVSPADEVPDVPGTPHVEALDVARALDAVNEVSDLGLRSVQRSWAGLRTFAPDGIPVVGPDPEVPGLFWCAGQGGYGIQVAPALADLTSALVEADPIPDHLATEGLDVDTFHPGRRSLRPPSD